ncbi:lethal(3)malignant brain tumor-like protein 3 isoform X2 [Panulirus ornatus]|uniref:lethal(3)malignant brain tumor-like protein 3 isoform X2 n=1 Tax=Panulirus ornatus TaxID=150431 RepID=UPI003A8B9049
MFVSDLFWGGQLVSERDAAAVMADQPVPEKAPTKVESKNKEPQKFLYLQLQQDRTGDGTGRVATLVGGRGTAGPAHFIPLTAKLNSISVLGSGSRPNRATVSVPNPRSQGTAVVTMAATRPVVATAVSMPSSRSAVVTAVTVTSPRPVIASPVTTIASKPGGAASVVRKTHSTNVVVSSGVPRPVMSPNATTITVLGSSGGLSGATTPVLRPATTQGAQPHGPVILHTSKVPPPVTSSTASSKGVSPRLVPIPITQVRTGVANKAVLSYSALLQAGTGGGSSGAGGGVTSKKEGQSSPHSPQPLLLQAATPSTVKGAAALAKTGGATISIITGKGSKQGSAPVSNTNPVNMLSVNLGQNKSNMINFKISNGQIQADNIQQVDVLREARPLLQSGKQLEERKDTPVVVAGTALAHAVGTGSVTVSVTGSVPATLKIPEPMVLPVTVPASQTMPEHVSSPVPDKDTLPNLKDVTVIATKREKDDILQRAVSTLGGALEDNRNGNDSHPLIPEKLSDSQHRPKTLSECLDVDDDNTRDESESNDDEPEIVEVKKDVLRTVLCKSEEPTRSSSPMREAKNDTQEQVKEENVEDSIVEKPLNNDTDFKDSKLTLKSEYSSVSDDVKPEHIKFSDLLKWENGVGKLDGSDLKFKMNEFNAVEIVEDRDLEEIKNHQSKKAELLTPRHHARKPNYREALKDEEIFSDNSQDSEPQGNKSTRESDDICRCKNCGCYGLSSEFFRDSSFCSIACGDEHDARELEWGKERLKQEKERQRRKRLKQSEKPDEEQAVGNEGKREGNRSDGEGAQGGSDDDSRNSKNVSLTSESLVSRFQHPWQDGKNNFSWVKYLEHCGRAKGLAKAAPLKIWPEPFPFSRNLFKPGMKLEAIDPAHQSLFCVMTVAEIIGYRLRLHFDGYSDQYDYWINADSPNIFPAGWCEKNGRQLEPPLGVIGFSWKAYLEHCKAQTAPRQAFINKGSSTIIPPNNFRVGMKLEAEDRKNIWVCVATVADVLDNRVLIHFDGWDKAFDVWNEVSSPYIHPVGWCAENNIILHPPNDYPNPESFNWHEYLQETNSMAVPARAFKTRPPREFKKNMKLEVVDKRNPSLIRVATIVDVQDYLLKIHFDGWGDEYDYLVDDDSPDIHPPSWCNKTGHALQPPLTPEQQAEDVDSGMGCGTPGCKGIGHVKGPIYTTHHTAYGCPYSFQNINKDLDSIIPDRLQPPLERKKSKAAPRVKLDLRPYSGNKDGNGETEEADCQKKRVRKRRKFFDELSPPEPNRPQKVPKLSNEEMKPITATNTLVSSAVTPSTVMSSTSLAPSTSSTHPALNNLTPQQAPPPDHGMDMMVHQSVFNPGYNPHPSAPLPHSWERHRHLTASLGDAKRSDVESWDVEQVQQLVARIPGCEQVATVFNEQQIDGEALLMMTQNDLVSLLHIKLGPAIKIMAVIMCLRSSSQK